MSVVEVAQFNDVLSGETVNSPAPAPNEFQLDDDHDGEDHTFVDTHMVRRLIVLLCVAIAAPILCAQPAAVTLGDVLRRAGAYVVDFERDVPGVVAEERYMQEVHYLLQSYGIGDVPVGETVPITRRLLFSDLLLVRPVGGTRWVQFRDVFSVDGKPVHDRNERLVKLFLQPTPSTAQQVHDIATESSRYNIGNLHRTINVPLLALLVLEPATQGRFVFRRTQDRRPRLGSEPKSDGDAQIWAVEYVEQPTGTLIRGRDDHDVPSHGRLWIEAASGRVVGTELIADEQTLKGTIDVTYRREPSINMLLPAEMRERYEVRGDSSTVDGTATYSKFRRFQVVVDETLAPLKPDAAERKR